MAASLDAMDGISPFLNTLHLSGRNHLRMSWLGHFSRRWWAYYFSTPVRTIIDNETNTEPMKALGFDAYGTLFDVFSVSSLCEELFPGHGNELAQIWRRKQLEYSWLRSLMGRYRDFWGLTEDALVYSANSLKLDLTPDRRDQLLESYLNLAAFPDVKPGLRELKQLGLRLAILSNGEPKMLNAAVQSAGIGDLIDTIVSVDSVRIFKPSPRVYDQLASDLEIDKAEIGFVSSNNWDVNGAASAGLTAFWIRRSNDILEELGYAATRVIGAVTDLPPLVSS